jgi:hypothetical protein
VAASGIDLRGGPARVVEIGSGIPAHVVEITDARGGPIQESRGGSVLDSRSGLIVDESRSGPLVDAQPAARGFVTPKKDPPFLPAAGRSGPEVDVSGQSQVDVSADAGPGSGASAPGFEGFKCHG